jgi:hypothetical protein
MNAYPPMPPLCREHQRLWKRWLNSTHEYEPFLHATDIRRATSSGCREIGFKSGRVHHMVSKQEFWAFQILDWSPRVLSIKEQYPIDPEITWRICCENGLEHSRLGDGLTVTTIDFYLAVMEGQKIVHKAIDVKMSEKLQDKEVLRKLEITRIWCEQESIRHRFWTERDIDLTLANNIKDMRDSLNIEEFNISKLQIESVRIFLDSRLNSGSPLSDLGLQSDKTMGLEAGTSLRIAKHLIMKGTWQYDLRHKFDPANPVTTQHITTTTKTYEGAASTAA